jgi:hypothetical protein
MAAIFPKITDKNKWFEVEKDFKQCLIIQKKRELGRQRKNRLKPAREAGGKPTWQVRCPNCLQYGQGVASRSVYTMGPRKGDDFYVIFWIL